MSNIYLIISDGKLSYDTDDYLIMDYEESQENKYNLFDYEEPFILMSFYEKNNAENYILELKNKKEIIRKIDTAILIFKNNNIKPNHPDMDNREPISSAAKIIKWKKELDIYNSKRRTFEKNLFEKYNVSAEDYFVGHVNFKIKEVEIK